MVDFLALQDTRSGFIMIEVTTKYTKEAYRKYQWFHMARGGARKVVFIILLAITFCAGVALMYTSNIADKEQIARFCLSLFAISLPLYYIFRPRNSANSVFKKSPALFEAGLTFTFHEDYFTVQSNGMVSGTSDIRYEALYCVYQTKDSFYLYLQQRQSYLIDKKHFTIGKPEDLAILMKKVMPAKKYRSYL